MNFKYGVEIEFRETLRVTDVRDSLILAGIHAEYASHYSADSETIWKVEHDGSCGLELVSPVLEGEEGFRQIEVVCRVLKSLGAEVDIKCGLHVHIDARGLSKKEIARVFGAYAKYEPIIDRLVPPSRRASNNGFCRSIRNVAGSWGTDSVKRFENDPISFWNMGRYYKVNLESYVRHSTIEFRQHSGTLDAEKIINWVVFLQSFVAVAKGWKINLDVNKFRMIDLRWKLNIRPNSENALVAECGKWIAKRFNELNKADGLKITSWLQV